jgi:hypothetical protein
MVPLFNFQSKPLHPGASTDNVPVPLATRPGSDIDMDEAVGTRVPSEQGGAEGLVEGSDAAGGQSHLNTEREDLVDVDTGGRGTWNR